jgi:hypothetical protein
MTCFTGCGSAALVQRMTVQWRAALHQLMVTLILPARLPLDLPAASLLYLSQIARQVRSYQGVSHLLMKTPL